MDNESRPSHCVVQIKEALSEKYLASIVDSYEEANEMIRVYEQENSLKFATWIISKDFGNIDFYQKKHKIWWEDDVFAFSGVPFAILGSKVLDCNFGKDRNLCAKKRRIAVDSDNPYKYPRSLRVTKKYGCPAQVHIKELVHFPDFWITSNTKWKREAGSKKLRQTVQDRNINNFKRSFVVLIPPVSAHLNHPPEPKDKTASDITPSELSQEITIQKQINFGEKCRELLDEIKTLSYLVEDDEQMMKDLQTNLETIKNYLVFVIHERNQATSANTSEIHEHDESPERHQIIVTKAGKLERKKIENPMQKESTMIVSREAEMEKLHENDTTVHLYIESSKEDRMTSPEFPKQNVKVMRIAHPSEINAASVIQTISSIKEHNKMDILQDEEIKPQEFEALTNMLHVLLEENKTNSTTVQ